MTVQIELRANFQFDTNGDRAAAERLLDALMVELVKLANGDSQISDPAMSADFSQNDLEIALIAEAASYDEATVVADSAVRSSAHAAGWNTSKWVLAKTSQKTDLVTA